MQYIELFYIDKKGKKYPLNRMRTETTYVEKLCFST